MRNDLEKRLQSIALLAARMVADLNSPAAYSNDDIGRNWDYIRSDVEEIEKLLIENDI